MNDLKLTSENSTQIILPNSFFEVDNYTELKEVLENINSSSDTWIYRGIKNEKYNLKSSIERMNIHPERRMIHLYSMIHEFYSCSANYNELNIRVEDDDSLLILSLLQHHGCPTNLLDWSFSPYVALFFAIEDIEFAVDNNNCCIWLLNNTEVYRIFCEFIDYVSNKKKSSSLLKILESNYKDEKDLIHS